MGITTAAFATALETFADRIHDARDVLTALDSAIGDADHGINMDRGMTAVREPLVTLREADDVAPGDFARGVRAGLDGIVALGKASLGDKTMVDALTPAVEALEA